MMEKTHYVIFHNFLNPPSPPQKNTNQKHKNNPPAIEGIKPMRSVEGSDNEQKSALALSLARTHIHTV